MIATLNVISVAASDREEPLLSSGEVAKRVGVSTSTVSSWVRQGWLTPHIRTAGGRLRFRWSDVERQLRERGQGTSP